MGFDRRDDMVTEARLKELYQSTMRPGSAACPAPEALQALARREGDEATRLATLQHAMTCTDCRAELDLLRTVERAGAELGVKARGGSARSRLTWMLPAALAATVLLAVGLGRSALSPGDEPLRSGDDAGAVAVVAPGPEAAAGEPLAFAWRPVAGASRYRVEVLTEGGDIAVEAETRDTAVTLEGVGRLRPGDYRWWVVALSPGPGPRSALRPLRLTAR